LITTDPPTMGELSSLNCKGMNTNAHG
jgi:hypothetical protein